MIPSCLSAQDVEPPIRSTVNITTNSVQLSMASPAGPMVAAAFIASAYATAPRKPQYHSVSCTFPSRRPSSSVGRIVLFSRYAPGKTFAARPKNTASSATTAVTTCVRLIVHMELPM